MDHSNPLALWDDSSPSGLDVSPDDPSHSHQHQTKSYPIPTIAALCPALRGTLPSLATPTSLPGFRLVFTPNVNPSCSIVLMTSLRCTPPSSNGMTPVDTYTHVYLPPPPYATAHSSAINAGPHPLNLATDTLPNGTHTVVAISPPESTARDRALHAKLLAGIKHIVALPIISSDAITTISQNQSRVLSTSTSRPCFFLAWLELFGSRHISLPQDLETLIHILRTYWTVADEVTLQRIG